MRIPTKKLLHKARKPTSKQLKAFQNLVENGGNKGKAIRDAGYSEAVAKTPEKVFGSLALHGLLEFEGKNAERELVKTLHALQENIEATEIKMMWFPPFNREIYDTFKRGETKNEQLVDDEIKELLAEVDCKVLNILYGKTGRKVYYAAHDNKTRLKATDMTLRLYGLYASRQKESKAKVSHFSMTDLRKQAESR
ncbi:MAG TPA: hypothetical protein VGO63_02115 [Candidatus Paceibacterota bacterium]|jgi:hypothetical protein|nr:hypothetical protein [Candidatus Paceibacterota bacterium]